jgi:hypothetical protein
MAGKEQVVSAIEKILVANPEGITGEALALLVGTEMGRQYTFTILAPLLRADPQRFITSEGGRWSP